MTAPLVKPFLVKQDKCVLPEDYIHIERKIKKAIIFNKDFFLAEYKSLRDEILQRISQQTTVIQIAITAWAAILAFALKSESPASNSSGESNLPVLRTVLLILVYPLLAHFISYAWIFNNIRIGQLGRYLRKREKQVSKLCNMLSWERYVKSQDTNQPHFFLFRGGKIKPGLAIFPGTQTIAVVTAAIVQAEITWIGRNKFILIGVFIVAILVTIITTFQIWQSEAAYTSRTVPLTKKNV